MSSPPPPSYGDPSRTSYGVPERTPYGVPERTPYGVPRRDPGRHAGRSLGVDPRHEAWMGRALELARTAIGTGDVPIGAVVVDPRGTVVGEGRNVREARGDPTGHAEIVALRAAAATLGTWRLDGCTLVVTVEPCPMCAGAASLSRLARIVLGAWDPKAGACGSVWDLVRDRHALHRLEVVGGVRDAECAELLLDFFGRRR